jgi:DNA-binding response OmpR family regulator
MNSLPPSGGIADERRLKQAQPAKADPIKLDNIAPVLIVEDNYHAAIELTRLLDEWGIETRCAARPAAARAVARDIRPKLGLIDINLEGGYEGLELARELQTLYGTRIVFVTAYHVRDLMHRLTGGENMAVLFKPVEREVLATVLAQLSTTIDSAQ